MAGDEVKKEKKEKKEKKVGAGGQAAISDKDASHAMQRGQPG
jgi:hypothetical protein